MLGASFDQYNFYIYSPGRYIICNQGIAYDSSPDTSLVIQVNTIYTDPNDGLIYPQVIIFGDTLAVSETLTFDVFVNRRASSLGPSPEIRNALLGANKVIATIVPNPPII
jgi:hypothetical protein